jgi:hypothetical protein
MGSLISCYVSVLALSRIPFQSYVLSNDTSRTTFNAISHE